MGALRKIHHSTQLGSVIGSARALHKPAMSAVKPLSTGGAVVLRILQTAAHYE